MKKERVFLLAILVFVLVARMMDQRNSTENILKEKFAVDTKQDLKTRFASIPPKITAEKLENPVEALEKSNLLVTRSTDLFENVYENAYAAFHAGDYLRAIHQANTILLQDPFYSRALNIKGIALCFSDQFDQGLTILHAAHAIAPNDWYILFNLGLAYAYQKTFLEAITWYEKSIEKYPYVWTYYGLAAVYAQMGSVEQSVSNLEVAIQIDPVVRMLIREEKDFDLIRNNESFVAIVTQEDR